MKSKRTPKAAADAALALLPSLDDLPTDLPQCGVTARVHRSKLTPAPYNPRTIDHYAASKLGDSIRRTGGLVDDPIWNRRSGFLVAGHQRLSQEDKRRGTLDYELSVKVVDWDDKMEREVNVALNNQDMSGRYDVEALLSLVRESDLSIENMGFDAVSLEGLCLDAGVSFDFAPPEEIVEAAADVQDAIEEADEARREEKEAAKIASIKQDRAKFEANQAFKQQTDVALTLVFPSTGLRDAFCKAVGLQRCEKADGLAIANFLELELEHHADHRSDQILAAVPAGEGG